MFEPRFHCGARLRPHQGPARTSSGSQCPESSVGRSCPSDPALGDSQYVVSLLCNLLLTVDFPQEPAERFLHGFIPFFVSLFKVHLQDTSLLRTMNTDTFVRSASTERSHFVTYK